MTALDPTALSPADLESAGVILSGYCHDDMRPTAGAVWKTHSEYLADNPQVDEIQRSAARLAAMRHLGGHDTLAGLTLPRSFPCLGRFLIIVDDGRRPATVVCSRCGDRLGVTQEAIRGAAQEATW